MAQVTQNTYDEVPYPSFPLSQTHPDHLATIATLLGLRPPPPDRCRVLELGCASGGNLIPLALVLPESSFLGVDMSSRQIAAGQEAVADLDLQNIELRTLSILDVDETVGSFDYILCHGVYSWVPAPVQDKILEICRRQLAPNGIAYVSYNTHPGWHLRGLIRHMMSYHVARYPADAAEQRVARARQLLDFLVQAAPHEDQSYTMLLREQSQLLSQHSDAYLFHEHLEEHNEPVWFLDFCERLSAHELRYLAEAQFGTMLAGVTFSPEVQRQLEALAPNLLEKEQYMDFVRNRSFRQTLICHAHQRPNYDLAANRLAQLSVAAPVVPANATPDIPTETREEFTSPDGPCVETAVPIVKAALACLGKAWPAAIPFEDLVDEARRLWNASMASYASASADDIATSMPGRDESRVVLGNALLETFARAHGTSLRLSRHAPRVATTISERPAASPLARRQAREGQPITNLRHEVVSVTPFDRHLLPLLDGTRNRDALLAGLVDLYRRGELLIGESDEPVTDHDRATEILGEVLNQQLPQLARSCLLWPTA